MAITALLSLFLTMPPMIHAADQVRNSDLLEKSFLDGQADENRVPPDYLAAAHSYQKPADSGNPRAQWALGRLYERGLLTHLYDEKEVEWYRMAAQRGDARAQDSVAVALYRMAAQQGDARAQDSLGRLYEFGWYDRQGSRVSADIKQAEKYYRMAAAQGEAHAQGKIHRYIPGRGYWDDRSDLFEKPFRVGQAYENQVPPDYLAAATSYYEAATRGNPRAQWALGRLCERGLVVIAADIQAVGKTEWVGVAMEWYREAANQGDARAQDALGRLYELGWYDRKGNRYNFDMEQAEIFYRMAAAQGEAHAQYQIGMYILGRGTRNNRFEGSRSEAWGLLNKAAKQGNPEAKRVLRSRASSTCALLIGFLVLIWRVAVAWRMRDGSSMLPWGRIAFWLSAGFALSFCALDVFLKNAAELFVLGPDWKICAGNVVNALLALAAPAWLAYRLAAIAAAKPGTPILQSQRVFSITVFMLPALALIIFFFSLRDFFLRGDIYALPWTLGAGAILWSAYLEIYPWLTTAPAPTIYYPPPEPVSVETASASLSQETRTSTGAPAPRADAVPSAATPVLGSALIGKKYEMVHRIGEGGMGLVYAGRDFELGRFVAIKKMRPELKLNAREKKRFMREAQLSAALHHPCIVEIYDIAEQDGEVYLIFEYVDGQTLDKRLDSGPMTAEELKPPLKFVCKALEFAHSKKVVHRDLKPSNIMITRQGFAKVMDFGIAREIKDTMSRLTRLDTSGTAAYMAPEQELGKFDGRADIYALGVTLYEALSGTPPFPGPNFLRQKELMEFKPLAEAAPTAPKEFCDAIERCLSFDANERFQTIAQFAAEAKT